MSVYGCSTIHRAGCAALDEAELEPGGACLGAKPPSVATPTPPAKGAAAVLMPAEAETPVAPVKAVFKDGQTPGPTPSPFMCGDFHSHEKIRMLANQGNAGAGEVFSKAGCRQPGHTLVVKQMH